MSLIQQFLSQWRRPAAAARAPEPAVSLEQYEAINPMVEIADGDTSVIYCTPSVGTRWRADTLFTKEPDTIAWIGGFRRDEVLVDIGANVGMYTIWAAKTRGARVFAFEPESQNYALLYRNIVANELSARVTAYCLALSDERAYSQLHLSGFSLGASCHTFGAKVDHLLRPRESRVSQGCVSVTLDELVGAGTIDQPDYIKIDVDGLEHKVLAGARATLRHPRLKSVLVELNTHLGEHREVIAMLQAEGFSFSAEQVAQALRTSGAFEGCGNHVFTR